MSKELVQVEVNAEDIRSGQDSYRKGEKATETCAVSLAASRAVGRHAWWGFFSGGVGAGVYGEVQTHVLIPVLEDTHRVENFVKDHDALRTVEPMSFMMEVETL